MLGNLGFALVWIAHLIRTAHLNISALMQCSHENKEPVGSEASLCNPQDPLKAFTTASQVSGVFQQYNEDEENIVHLIFNVFINTVCLAAKTCMLLICKATCKSL